MKDSFSPQGTITFQLKKADGTIKETVVENLVVQSGRAWITARLSDNAIPSVMSTIGVGEGDANEPALGDTALESQIAVGGLQPMTIPGGTVTANVIAYEASFPAANATGAIVEAGIFNDANVMLSRATFPVINKQLDDTLNIIWRVRIQ